LKQLTIGTFSRTGDRSIKLNTSLAEMGGELAEVSEMRGPAYESRGGQFSQIARVWRFGLLRIRCDDFEIVPFTKREKRISRPAASMNATEGRADISVIFDEGYAEVEIVASEKNMIEYRRRINLSLREFWIEECAAG
jgi:hypothetical protein